MPVLFDTTILLPLLNPDVPAPPDPKTGGRISHLQERILGLIKDLEREKTKIIIPTPALAEVLVRAGKAAERYFDIINQSACFKIFPFEQRAALEVAAMAREELGTGDWREGSGETKAKVKFDRQIVAIAKVAGVSKIYSDDKHIRVLATKLRIEVVGLTELELPPEDRQTELPLSEAGAAVTVDEEPLAERDARDELLASSENFPPAPITTSDSESEPDRVRSRKATPAPEPPSQPAAEDTKNTPASTP